MHYGENKILHKMKAGWNQGSKHRDYPKEPVEKFINKSVIQPEKKEQVKLKKQVIECFRPHV